MAAIFVKGNAVRCVSAGYVPYGPVPTYTILWYASIDTVYP